VARASVPRLAPERPMDAETLGQNLQAGGAHQQRFDKAARQIAAKAVYAANLLAPGGERVEFDDVRVEGEAMIYIRRGKRIGNFDYRINTPWRLRLRHGELVTGHLEVPEFTNSCGEVPEDMEVRIPFARDWHCSPETAQNVLAFMRKDGSAMLREALRDSAAAIQEAALSPPAEDKRGPPDLQRLMQQARDWDEARGPRLA